MKKRIQCYGIIAATVVVLIIGFYLAVSVTGMSAGYETKQRFGNWLVSGAADDTLYHMEAALPTQEEYYDSLLVNEACAGRIEQTLNAILTSEDASHFYDNYYNTEEGERIRAKNAEDIAKLFGRYHFLNRSEEISHSCYRLTWAADEMYGEYDRETGRYRFANDARVSESDAVMKLEKAGYDGLKAWMQEVEERWNINRQSADGRVLYSEAHETILSGTVFRYSIDSFSLEFQWNEYYVRPEIASEIAELTGDGLRIQRSTANGEITMLEYTGVTPDVYVLKTDGTPKQIQLYYKDNVLTEIVILVQNTPNFGMQYPYSKISTLFGKNEIEFMSRFLEKLGLNEQERAHYLTMLEQAFESGEMSGSGSIGAYAWSSECKSNHSIMTISAPDLDSKADGGNGEL